MHWLRTGIGDCSRGPTVSPEPSVVGQHAEATATQRVSGEIRAVDATRSTPWEIPPYRFRRSGP